MHYIYETNKSNAPSARQLIETFRNSGDDSAADIFTRIGGYGE